MVLQQLQYSTFDVFNTYGIKHVSSGHGTYLSLARVVSFSHVKTKVLNSLTTKLAISLWMKSVPSLPNK